MMATDSFYHDLRGRVANLAIGPSSLRNMVGQGGVTTAQEFCTAIDLSRLGNRTKFRGVLDAWTNELKGELPRRKKAGGNRWGPARKVLNIFLADACYNCYLREKYELEKIEPLLEVPLDSFVQKGIISDMKELGLPLAHKSAAAVISIDTEINEIYQQAAARIAKRENKPRIFLDLRYWRRKQLEPKNSN